MNTVTRTPTCAATYNVGMLIQCILFGEFWRNSRGEFGDKDHSGSGNPAHDKSTVYINTVAANALGHVTKSARAVVARALPETLVPTASRRP